MTTIDRDQLVESAKDYADRALRAYMDGDSRVILSNAAFSAEHIAKAYLVDLNPVLLMEIRNGKLDSLLHLSGLGDKAKTKSPRTISAREARSRVELLLPGLTAPKKELDDLIDVRDGIVHVGFLAKANTREILTAYLRFANGLFDGLNVPADARWGSHTEMVNKLISQSLTEIEHEVERKIAAAKRFLGDLMENIPEEARESVGAARQAQWERTLPEEDHEEEVTCPACKDKEAKCFGVIDTEYDPDVIVEEGHATVLSVGAIHTMHARRLVCGICNLRLDTPDELKAAELETSWITEDYFEEPDFDHHDI